RLPKYGADDFENANDVFIFPGNTWETFLKMKWLFGQTTGPAQKAGRWVRSSVSRLVRLPSAGGAHRPFGRDEPGVRRGLPGLLSPERHPRRDWRERRRQAGQGRAPAGEGASNLTAQRSGQVDRSVELVGVASGISAEKYGADAFENANAIIIFPVNTWKTFLKMKRPTRPGLSRRRR